MKVLEENRVSELIAKRRVIERALAYWANEEAYFVKLRVSYFPAKPNAKKAEEEILARREVVSQFLGLECVAYWKHQNGSLLLNKEEYLELWRLLATHEEAAKDGQPKERLWDKIKRTFKPSK